MVACRRAAGVSWVVLAGSERPGQSQGQSAARRPEADPDAGARRAEEAGRRHDQVRDAGRRHPLHAGRQHSQRGQRRGLCGPDSHRGQDHDDHGHRSRERSGAEPSDGRHLSVRRQDRPGHLPHWQQPHQYDRQIPRLRAHRRHPPPIPKLHCRRSLDLATLGSAIAQTAKGMGRPSRCLQTHRPLHRAAARFRQEQR